MKKLKNVLKIIFVIILVLSIFYVYKIKVSHFEQDYKEDLEMYYYCISNKPEVSLQDEDCLKFKNKILEANEGITMITPNIND